MTVSSSFVLDSFALLAFLQDEPVASRIEKLLESAGKQIAGLRLKRAGARWTEEGALTTAKARAAWLSGTWDVLVAKRAALPLAA